jgi:hypothetical protein
VNRRMVVLLAILGVLVVVFLARAVLSGGGDDGGGDGGAETSATTAVTTTTTTVGGGGDGGSTGTDGDTAPVDEFEVFATRDPFEPVITLTPDTTPVTTPVTTPGTTPTTPSTSTTPGGATTTTTVSPGFEPVPGEQVTVLDVFVDASGATMARVQVGSTVYTVAVGDTFATSYQVVSLEGTCGTFLYGDATFTLCEGEQVIK